MPNDMPPTETQSDPDAEVAPLPAPATVSVVVGWVGLIGSILLLLESASITLTNDESGGLIRIDLLFVFVLAPIAGIALIGGGIGLMRRAEGTMRAIVLSVLALAVLCVCWFAGHEIFVVTANIADAVGWRPKDCISDSSPGFDWGKYCPV